MPMPSGATSDVKLGFWIGVGLLLLVDGRIDSYWSDHLDAALDAAVREGHHRIAVRGPGEQQAQDR